MDGYDGEAGGMKMARSPGVRSVAEVWLRGMTGGVVEEQPLSVTLPARHVPEEQ